jgi:tellurite resistance protein TehA-like permease
MHLFRTAAQTLGKTFLIYATLTLQLPAMFLVVLQDEEKKGDVYSILWALVFGFATLNILGLVAKHFEPNRTRMNFGETLAIMVVVVAVFLLGWEMLYLFHVLPIKLHAHGD